MPRRLTKTAQRHIEQTTRHFVDSRHLFEAIASL